MVDENHFAADEIKARIGHLKDHWTQLKAKCEQRRQDLEDSLQAHQYFSDAAEAEAFMKEKESLAGMIWQYGWDKEQKIVWLKINCCQMKLVNFENPPIPP